MKKVLQNILTMMIKRNKHQSLLLILEESIFLVVCRNQRVIELYGNTEKGDSNKL